MGQLETKVYNHVEKSLEPNWTSEFTLFDFDSYAHRDLENALKIGANEKKPILLIFKDYEQRLRALWPLALFAEAIVTYFVLAVVDTATLSGENYPESIKNLLPNNHNNDNDNNDNDDNDEKDSDLMERKKIPQGAFLASSSTKITAATVLAVIEDAGHGANICTDMIRLGNYGLSGVPFWVHTARQEFARPSLARATFAVPCYWQGEGAFGKLHGVTGLIPGFFGGSGEVVEVVYDDFTLSYSKLAQVASSRGWSALPHNEEQRKAAQKVGVEIGQTRDPSDPVSLTSSSENKHYMKSDTWYHHILFNHEVYNKLPLTPLQQARANAVRTGLGIDALLSPVQKKLMQAISKNLALVSKNIDYFPDQVDELPAFEKNLCQALNIEPFRPSISKNKN